MLRKILAIVILLACFSLLGRAYASAETLVVDPGQEVIRTVDSHGCVSICGNLSVTQGYVDFFITGPSGKVLLLYNKTPFTDFNVTTVENGTYAFHIANTWSPNATVVTLCYGKNFEVVLQENLKIWHDVSTWTFVTSTPTPPMFPFGEQIMQFLLTMLGGVLVTVLSALLIDVIRERRQKWKDGESKTPVVIKYK
jgi:hypothetical protein